MLDSSRLWQRGISVTESVKSSLGKNIKQKPKKLRKHFYNFTFSLNTTAATLV